MANSNNFKLDLKKFMKKINRYVVKATDESQMRLIAQEAIKIIRRRTRLGYGAPLGEFGTRFKFQGLAPSAIENRERYRRYLSNETTPKRSNLTMTGQMLDSMQIIRVSRANVVVGPYGMRTGPFANGLTNQKVADYVGRRGRTFNNLTIPEVKQLQRFYRKTFADLKP